MCGLFTPNGHVKINRPGPQPCPRACAGMIFLATFQVNPSMPVTSMPVTSMPVTYWLFVLLTLGLIGLVSYATYRTTQLLAYWPPDQNPLLNPAENGVRLLLIAICLGLGWLSGQPLAQLGWQFAPIVPQLLWGIGWGGALAGFYMLATRWLMARTGQRYYSTALLRVIVPRNGRDLAGIALAMLPIVVVEELLFRSLLIGGLAPIAPLWLLLLFSGIAFGLMHSPQGWWGMGAIGVGGVLLGWMLVATGSLLLPVIAHYVTNMAQIALAYRLWLRQELPT